LVVETPEGNLVAGMRWLLSTYSNRFNRRHQLCGHVFSGRYKALVVDGGGSGYLRTVCDYTHLNPVRAGLLSAENRLLEYPWSSFGYYLREAKHRPKWLRVDRLLGEHGIGKDTASGRLEFERRMEGRRSGEGEAKQWQGMRRGWCLGTPEFKKGLLERMHGQLGPNHSASLRREASGERGEGIIAQELRRLGWKEGDLSLRPISVLRHVYDTGITAIPIVSLIAFLISVILAYMGAQQLVKFGADIFVVDLVTVGVLRELGVLLTAIIVAGRSGSAFAAEIGAMQLNEEVDALHAIGVEPIEVLVLWAVLVGFSGLVFIQGFSIPFYWF